MISLVNENMIWESSQITQIVLEMGQCHSPINASVLCAHISSGQMCHFWKGESHVGPRGAWP